jgi:hypothetical protein
MPNLSPIERVYYQLLNSGQLFKMFPQMTGYYADDEIEFTTIYLLLNE